MTTVPSDGSFELHVPPGSYFLVGSSPLFEGGKYECEGKVKVTVLEDQAVIEDVVCPEK